MTELRQGREASAYASVGLLEAPGTWGGPGGPSSACSGLICVTDRLWSLHAWRCSKLGVALCDLPWLTLL